MWIEQISGTQYILLHIVKGQSSTSHMVHGSLAIGCQLPTIKQLHDAKAMKGARKIADNPAHPGDHLFTSERGVKPIGL